MAKKGMSLPEGFARLSPNSSYWRAPRTSTGATNDHEPELLICCSWMGAQRKHVAKYIAKYQEMLPTTDILLIQSQILDMTYRPFKQQQHNLLPATKVLQERLERGSTASEKSIVLHIFSHGGSNSAIQLLRTWENISTIKPPTLPISSFILDSTPGLPSYTRGYEAAATGMPKSGLLRILGLLLVHITAVLLYIMVTLKLTKGIKQLREDLLDPSLFPKDAKRVYLYSKADRMIDWEAVRSHADEAVARGYAVEQLCFESSPHCGHVMEDAEGYWRIVAGSWEA